MSAALDTKRTEVLANAKKLRETAGSGWHDEDKGSPQYCECKGGKHKASCKAGLPIDEHLVAFKARFETALSGECASKALAAVKEYASENAATLSKAYHDHHERKLIDTANEYAANPLVDGNMVVRNGQWNDIVEILHAKGLEITLTA
jgi:hypothetical protein